MKKLLGVVCLVASLASVLAAATTIRTENGVANASSYTADIARGSWFVIFGAEMGPVSISVYSGALPYPTTLSGTSVTFTPASGGAVVSARMWYTLAGQLAGMLPSTAAAGDYDVRVTYNGSTSAPYRVKVVERNFGFATQSQNGQGPAQATYGGLDLNRFTTGSLGQWSTRPAKPNDTMVAWGTGIGADANSDLSGATTGDQTAAGQIRVIVGGIEVTPLYAGRSNGSPGLDQINFVVPGNVTPGCFVSFAVRAGGRTSNLGSIAVAGPGQTACTHPSYTQAQLTKLDQGGTLTIGSLTLSKLTSSMSYLGQSINTTTETASGAFSKYTVDAVSTANFSFTQIGACYVFKRSGSTTDIALGVAPSPLDAGTQLTLNGPNASNKAIPRVQNSKSYNSQLYYSGVLGFGGSGTPTIAQGTYTIAGPGGTEIGPFSAQVAVPGDFVWTNQATIPDPIPRSSNLNITWTGGSTGLVFISGMGMIMTGGTQQNPIYDATVFNCVAQATAGSFAVPSSVLQQLPVVSSDPTGSAFGNLSVMAVPDTSTGQGAFTAPVVAGGNTDQAFFTYAIGGSKITGWL
jgi:uncharacterized protein (TIGR03437 family)